MNFQKVENTEDIMRKVISLIAIIMVMCILSVGFTGCDDSETVGTETPVATGNATDSADEGLISTEAPVPTSDTSLPLSGVVVCVNAGHQLTGNKEKEPCAPWDASKNSEYNIETLKAKCTSGATGQFTGIPEYITTLQISKCIETTLKDLGATVVMIRDVHEVDISNVERAKKANEVKADVFLNVHCNSSTNASANGIDLYVRGSGDGSSEYLTKAT